MIERHLMKLRARDEISEADEQTIRSAISELREYKRDTTFIRANERLEHSTLLLNGMMCRYKDLSEGQRQIIEIHVPGDFVDLHSFTLKRLDHNVMTLTPCTVALVPHERLQAITECSPHLTRVYWFSTNLDAAMHREWEVSLGRRKAVSAMAHLFCELNVRLGIVGLSDSGSYDLDLTQQELGECLGISTVHVNRALQMLRASQCVEFRSGRVSITDLAGLERLAEFDPGYLYLDRSR
jgi:CRP-like cAMP-binding protein